MCIFFSIYNQRLVLNEDLNGHHLDVVPVVETSSVHQRRAALSFSAGSGVILPAPLLWQRD